MKKNRKWLAAALGTCIVLALNGCGKTAVETETVKTETVKTEDVVETTEAVETAKQAESTEDMKETRTITDSVGREVEIPAEITKIAPSGPLAQLVLYTVCPDKMAGLASDFTDSAKMYIDEKYWSLPTFGQFYGKNANLNMEALIAEAPDVIFDIGEAKKTVKEDMDALQEQLNIPVIFVEATLPTMADAYEMLGDITGETEQAQKLANYCRTEVKKADQISQSIADADKKTIYYALGDDGLHTNARGSIHADIIERVGAVNVADVEVVSKGTGSEVSFEQVLLWNPDIILVDSLELYEKLSSDSMWKNLAAVAEDHVYKIPSAPYNFMRNPPSVNRIIGIEWLGNLVYPEQYTGDLKAKVQEFYKLFYHIDVTEEQLTEILENSLAES